MTYKIWVLCYIWRQWVSRCHCVLNGTDRKTKDFYFDIDVSTNKIKGNYPEHDTYRMRSFGGPTSSSSSLSPFFFLFFLLLFFLFPFLIFLFLCSFFLARINYGSEISFERVLRQSRQRDRVLRVDIHLARIQRGIDVSVYLVKAVKKKNWVKASISKLMLHSRS